ncbi:hypothetical protein [Paraburkholderia sp. J67]|uniref:hypothetical protein n=1 Tax=Paraburkholderia sp. J67 TaxID=2805435 RepID=UPI002ABE0992|nr:hypothetical protein [Paraburkholderia sp. J67]
MLVIKIFIGLAIIFGLYTGVKRFNILCNDKFGHVFFTKHAFIATIAALILILIGNWWRQSAAQSHGDVLNGIIIMALGLAIAGYMIVVNVRETDIVYGVGGSVVQLGAFFILAYLAIPLMIVAAFFCFFANARVVPVRVVNK